MNGWLDTSTPDILEIAARHGVRAQSSESIDSVGFGSGREKSETTTATHLTGEMQAQATAAASKTGAASDTQDDEVLASFTTAAQKIQKDQSAYVLKRLEAMKIDRDAAQSEVRSEKQKNSALQAELVKLNKTISEQQMEIMERRKFGKEQQAKAQTLEKKARRRRELAIRSARTSRLAEIARAELFAELGIEESAIGGADGLEESKSFRTERYFV